MTANFVDVMLIDADTHLVPVRDLSRSALDGRGAAAVVAAAARAVLVARSRSACGCASRCSARCDLLRGAERAVARACRWIATRRSIAPTMCRKFARSGVDRHGRPVTARLSGIRRGRDRAAEPAADGLQPAAQPPHIVMVLDESSFDISACRASRSRRTISDHFRSFDGKARTFWSKAPAGRPGSPNTTC